MSGSVHPVVALTRLALLAVFLANRGCILAGNPSLSSANNSGEFPLKPGTAISGRMTVHMTNPIRLAPIPTLPSDCNLFPVRPTRAWSLPTWKLRDYLGVSTMVVMWDFQLDIYYRSLSVGTIGPVIAHSEYPILPVRRKEIGASLPEVVGIGLNHMDVMCA